MKSYFSVAALLCMFGSGAAASSYVLDFDGPDPSLDSSVTQTVSNPRIFSDDGVMWQVTTGGGLGAALFNTLCAGYTANCNDDRDLTPVVQGENGVAGNVLIQQRPNGSLTPNDDANTDSITLMLMSDVQLRWTGVSAVDDGSYVFTTSVDGALPLGTISLASDRETGSASFLSGVLSQGDTITIDFKSANPNSNTPETDSGGVDRLTFSVVPVPASLPLLLAGFGAFAAVRSRKKKN